MKITAQPGDTNILQAIIDVIGFILFAFAQIFKSVCKVILPQSYQRLKDVQGEIALVTGGGGGLGRLLALRLAKLGATVVLWDVNAKGEYSERPKTITYLPVTFYSILLNKK